VENGLVSKNFNQSPRRFDNDKKIHSMVIGDLIEISDLRMLAAVEATKNKISEAVAVVSTSKKFLIPSVFVSGQRTR
jgi:hypothetical protein